MARQVLPWVGAAVGFAAGTAMGNPYLGAQIGFTVGGLVGNYVDPQVFKGPALGEGQNNSASEGGCRPIVLGIGRVGSCLIHEGPLKERTIEHQQSKGGGPVTEETRRYRTMAFALGESAYPETGVLLTRLWIDGKLRYDVTPTSQIVEESEAFAEEFTFYSGTDAQEPDPDLEAMPVENGGGVGNVPSYKGGCPYLVLPDWDVTDSQGRAPVIQAELASSGGGTAGTQWLMSAGFTDSKNVNRSPDGIDWTSPSIDGPSALSYYRHEDEILCLRGGSDAGYMSYDIGDSWSSIEISLDAGVVGPARAAKVGEYWYIASTVYQTWRFDGETSEQQGWSSWTFASLSDVLFTVSSLVSNNVVGRNSDGAILWTTAFRSEFGNSATLGASDTEVGLLWTGSGQTPHLSTVNTVGGVVEVGCPFTEALEIGENHMLCYSRDLELWVLVQGDRVAYGTNLSNLVLSENVLPERGLSISEDGSKFVIVGYNRMCVYSTDGDNWTSATVSNTQPDTTLNAVIALEYASDIVVQPVPLSSIISWCHDRVDADLYDVSQLTEIMVEGVVFADVYTAADAIRAGSPLYNYDAGEYDAGSGYKVNYVLRGGAATVTLTEDDVVEGPEEWEREDSYERPRFLHVAYPNPDADYAAPVITIKRTSPDVKVVGERSASTPFVFRDVNEITRRADVMMAVMYTRIAGTYELVLPWSLLSLAPTDPIGYSIRGNTRRLMLDKFRFSPDGTIRTEFWADRQSAYTSNVTGLPVPPTSPPPPSIVGPTVSAVLDIPAVVDALDSLHMIVAASGQLPAWYGSTHQRKTETDADYTTMLSFNAPGSVMGVLQDDITSASPHYTDTTNVVRVTLYRDTSLSTYTQAQFLSENGAFALSYDDGGVRKWSILQYRDAVKVGERTWELTTLLRGRLNTASPAHVAGSLFVLLNSGIKAMPMQIAMLGEDITHRAISNGHLPDSAVPSTEEYTGQSQIEWPVAHLFVERDGDDIDCLTVPRHRFGTDMNPIRSINWQAYRWTATDGSNTATVDTVTETNTFNVTGWASPITVSVSQVNRITGAGPAVSEVIA